MRSVKMIEIPTTKDKCRHGQQSGWHTTQRCRKSVTHAVLVGNESTAAGLLPPTVRFERCFNHAVLKRQEVLACNAKEHANSARCECGTPADVVTLTGKLVCEQCHADNICPDCGTADGHTITCPAVDRAEWTAFARHWGVDGSGSNGSGSATVGSIPVAEDDGSTEVGR